ncbi:MAG: hypothetical protein JWM27_3454, partial [Gemmatimonadetes bacterium]|nr:hypothetical protein [Gemmatimonadota bacterium]
MNRPALARLAAAALLAFSALPVLALPAAAQEGVRVQRRGPARVSVVPGATATLVFQVSVTSVSADAVPTVGLPAGWRLVAAEGAWRPVAGAGDTRLLSVLVPADARAGAYTVRYAVRAGGAEARDSAVVAVAERHRLELRAMDAPRFAVAGAGYGAAFLLRNAGNVAERVMLAASSPRAPAADVEAPEAALAPGE